MNIKEAKDQIRNAMTAYFTKDEFGNYVIPSHQQRPVFLMGAPGIGKTAIMEQIAQELNVGLVSYSMTHHTRQSALGLPFIVKKKYGDYEYDISEYTMSEIIASVYDMIEETGHKEGILFLDEINCVSETLAPAMLQFLQYKIFGRHKVPEGWIVVTAGNPPEFNNSVREFDIATWDRLKRIDVEPDYEIWKKYAINKGVHPSITTYLDIKKSDFYKIESTVDGKQFVTARGWSDLSDMIKLYELNKIKVDETLIKQYLQNKKIAKSFAIYYDLFNKYKSDYQIPSILDGSASIEIIHRASEAKFDEKLSLLGLILDSFNNETKNVYLKEQIITNVLKSLQKLKSTMLKDVSNSSDSLTKEIKALSKYLKDGKKATSLNDDEVYALNKAIKELERYQTILIKTNIDDGKKAFELIKKEYTVLVQTLKDDTVKVGQELTNIFKFVETAFTEGQELLILVTELTYSQYSAHFISRYGCEEYFKHNKDLLFYERQKEIISQIDLLDLK